MKKKCALYTGKYGSVYAIYRGIHVSIVLYMAYIPVYSVYAKYRGVPVSIVLYMVYIPV